MDTKMSLVHYFTADILVTPKEYKKKLRTPKCLYWKNKSLMKPTGTRNEVIYGFCVCQSAGVTRRDL